MKRKLLSLITLVLFTYQTNAQEQKHRISLIGDLDVEMVTESTRAIFIGAQYQYTFKERQNISAHLAFDKNGGGIFGVDYIYDLPIIGKKLEFNIGGGLGRLIYREKYKSNNIKVTLEEKIFTISGYGGFTYNFSKSPISISAAYRPKLDFPTFDLAEPTTMLLGVGYRF